MLDDRIDVAVGAFASPMNGLVSQALHREQHWLYCSDKHPLFGRKRVPPEVITQQRMVTRGYWSEQELARQGFPPTLGDGGEHGGAAHPRAVRRIHRIPA